MYGLTECIINKQTNTATLPRTPSLNAMCYNLYTKPIRQATDDVNFALYKIKITSGLPHNMAESSHMLH